jgi:hypothetical protein
VLLAAEQLIEALKVLFVHSPLGPVIHCKNEAIPACVAWKEPLYDVVMTTVNLSNRIAVRINRKLRKFLKGKRRTLMDM